MRCFAIALLSGATLLAQVNPRELVRQSIINGEKAWRESRAYSYEKLEVDKEFGSASRVKSSDTDLYNGVPAGGESFEEHVKHDGQPVSPEEMRKQRQELRKLERLTPAQRAARLAKEERERSFYQEIPHAFNFKIIGEENLPTGPAWVLQATPRPGFQPHSRYAHMFPKMQGKLWIDKKDIQWVKADAVAIGNVYFGYFIARLAKGSHIILEQTSCRRGTFRQKPARAHSCFSITISRKKLLTATTARAVRR